MCDTLQTLNYEELERYRKIYCTTDFIILLLDVETAMSIDKIGHNKIIWTVFKKNNQFFIVLARAYNR